MENVVTNIGMAKRISGAAFVLAIFALVVTAVIISSSTVSAGDMRPFKGDASGVFTGPDSGQGTVIATHIGKGTVEFSGLVLDFSSPTPDGSNVCFPVIAGSQTLGAANGDEIFMEFVGGSFCIAGLPVHGDFALVITGGSGRFDDAVGVINIDAVAGGFPTWTSTFTEGSWIHY